MNIFLFVYVIYAVVCSGLVPIMVGRTLYTKYLERSKADEISRKGKELDCKAD